jgi:toxin ParE1/3/4
MRIDWSESALTDLDGVEAYFGQYNLGAAVAAVDRITECVDLLEKFPEMGYVGKYPGTREIVVARNQCVVIYKLQQETIRILRVIHGGQERPKKV